MAIAVVEDNGLSNKQFEASLGFIVAFRILTTLVVLGRLGCSKHKRFRLWTDDWLIGLASVRKE